MHAVIQLGGQQHLVKKGDELLVDRLDSAKGSLSLEALALFDESDIMIGSPTVAGSKVTLKVSDEPVRGPKVKIMKFQAKKRVKTLTGHRQPQSRVTVADITAAKK